jgi:hypothetical protein
MLELDLIRDALRKPWLWVCLVVVAMVIYGARLDRQDRAEEREQHNDRLNECSSYAYLIRDKAKQCPTAAGGLLNVDAQTRNCMGASLLMLNACRDRVSHMRCENFANGAFIDACFP